MVFKCADCFENFPNDESLLEHQGNCRIVYVKQEVNEFVDLPETDAILQGSQTLPDPLAPIYPKFVDVVIKKRKRYSCEVCDKEFIQNSHKVEHMRIHTGEKPFACEVCDKTFALRSSIVKHMRTHTGEKPHTCEVCEKTFAELCHKVVHMRTHTNELPYSCDVCHKKFSRHCTKTRHMKTHS